LFPPKPTVGLPYPHSPLRHLIVTAHSAGSTDFVFLFRKKSHQKTIRFRKFYQIFCHPPYPIWQQFRQNDIEDNTLPHANPV